MQSLNPIHRAFFSYAHEDAEFVLRLAKDLRAAGASVWMDRLDIKPGERWDRAVEDALKKCPELLVILTEKRAKGCIARIVPNYSAFGKRNDSRVTR